MQTHTHSATWYDVLSFLTLALVLGLFVGAALGGVALLLTPPAHGAERTVPALQAPAQRATYYDAGEGEPQSGSSEIVLPACEGQAARAGTGRHLEM